MVRRRIGSPAGHVKEGGPGVVCFARSPTLRDSATRRGEMNPDQMREARRRRTMRRYLIAGIVTIVGIGGAASPAWAQARGSAEASAAAVVNPKWTPPKLAWGHPDL